MPKMTVNGAAYSYIRRGRGHPLVLLHGFTGSKQSWVAVIGTLAQQFDVIAVDLLGHGETEAPTSPSRYTMVNAARDIASIIENLELSNANLLGYSMGGRLALYLALHYPQLITSLILESASPGIADPLERARRKKQDEDLARRIERDGVGEFIARWEQHPLFASQAVVSQEQRDILRNQRLQNSAIGLANSLRGMGTGNQPSLWEFMGTLKQRTLLLCGELDKKYVQITEKMSIRMPGAWLEVVHSTGHNIHFERPHEFTSAVVNFLNPPG